MEESNVIIVGAPRSGTNMLRDVLTSLDGICTWPCDEINYIWRHGNVRYPSDEIPESHATDRVKAYIRSEFEAIRRRYNATIVVEKTCANALRVPFVDAVLPDAKYINIVRDGVDATGSAKLRWQSKMDLLYILKKVRFVPLSDLPFYGVRYFWARVYKLFSRDDRLAFWGPALDDMSELLQMYSLDEVCALQWQRCVEKSRDAMSKMPENKVIHISYEKFVRDPVNELSSILKFLGLQVQDVQIAEAVKGVNARSLGKGRDALGEDGVKKLEQLVGNTLTSFGYK